MSDCLGKTRPFWRNILLAGGALSALLAVILLSRMILEITDARENFGENKVYYISQMERELQNLTRAVRDVGFAVEGADKEHLVLQFDIFWSRTFQPSGTPATETYEFLPGGNQTFAQIRETLGRIDPFVQELRIGDRDSAKMIVAELDELRSSVHSMVLMSLQLEADFKNKRYTSQVYDANIGIVLLFVVILLTFVSFVRIQRDDERISALVDGLEQKVSERTSELQSSLVALEKEGMERKSIQSDLEIREARLAQATEISGLGYYIWDPEDKVCTFVSDRHASMHNLSEDEFRNLVSGRDVPAINIFEEDFAHVNSSIDKLHSEELVDFEYRIDVQGTIRWVRELAGIWVCVASGQSRWIGTTIDITEQKRMQSQILQKHELEVVGRLTGGIAHDFNNLLSIIIGNVEFIESCQTLEDQSIFIKEVRDASYRAASLTKQLLSYGRKARLDPEDLDPKEVISKSVSMLERLLPSRITLNTEFEKNLQMIRADRAQLETVLLNLALNSRDAIGGDGQIEVHCKNVNLVDKGDTVSADLALGKYVCISFTDSGDGIPEESLPRIFEPYFTTKKVGQGSGLGLSMVVGFARQSGGDVVVGSEIGVGTQVRLFLPAATATCSIDTTRRINQTSPNESVLLVEDDPSVLQVIKRQLSGAGYVVHAYSRSEIALADIRAGLMPSVIVTDVVMPGEFQGPDLAREINELLPEVPVVFISGYPTGFGFEHEKSFSDHALISKPVRKELLISAIGDAINGKRKKLGNVD